MRRIRAGRIMTPYEVLGNKAVAQRCHWYKRENLVRDLPAGRQAEFRRKLQHGYQQPTFEKAKAATEESAEGAGDAQPIGDGESR